MNEIRPVAGGDAGFAAYDDEREFLNDHLERVAALYQAQAVAWQRQIAAHKPESLWGMIHISDSEIADLLSAAYQAPGELPPDLRAGMTPYWAKAEALARRIESRVSATAGADGFRLPRLCALCGLGERERDILLLCLLPELDARYRRLTGYLLDDATRVRPSLDLLLRLLFPLLADPARGRALFSPEAPLRRHHLLRLGRNGDADEITAENAVVLDPRIVSHLLGDDAPDHRLSELLEAAPPPPSFETLPLEPAARDRIAALPDWIETRRAGGQGSLIHLQGAPGVGRRALAAAVAGRADRPLLIVHTPGLMLAADGWPLLLDLVYREALLREADLLFAEIDEPRLPETGEVPVLWPALAERAARHRLTTWLSGTRAWSPAARQQGGDAMAVCLELPPPPPSLRGSLWRQALPKKAEFATPAPDCETLAGLLTDGFQLNAGQIDNAVRLARSFAIRRAPDQPLLTVEDLYEACRRQTGDRLVHLARRIEPAGSLGFDDLALRPESRRQIDELRQRIRLRTVVHGTFGFAQRLAGGGGFTVLFTGTSGTGKTMAAQLLAREQGVDLYKIDLSAVVSKYVGETEKNLEKIFSEAEDANALLFFDEADSLFGKRGDVKEARDRWANLEINYLLQRVEEFSGVVILATNLRQNIDEAFLRRIHAIVEFPFPDAETRARIWSGMFPTGIGAPPRKVIAELAERFELAGGSIRNVTVDAAFRAVADCRSKKPRVSERHLVTAVCREYLKLGKPVTPGEFGNRYYGMIATDILGEQAPG